MFGINWLHYAFKKYAVVKKLKLMSIAKMMRNKQQILVEKCITQEKKLRDSE